MAYLDGLKRAIEDEDLARMIDTKYTKISDPKDMPVMVLA
jgi:hypothetical protein